MATLRENETWSSLSEMLSTHALLQEEEQEVTKFSQSKSMSYTLEKVFPVYAMTGLSKPDPNSADLFPNSGSTVGDPIWDAVREEAKLEVPTILYIFSLLLLRSVTKFTRWLYRLDFRIYAMYALLEEKKLKKW